MLVENPFHDMSPRSPKTTVLRVQGVSNVVRVTNNIESFEGKLRCHPNDHLTMLLEASMLDA